LLPTPSKTIQFIEFTYCHDKFPNTAHIGKTAKYNPLIHALKVASWQVNPLITTWVRGAIHKQPIKDLEKLQITQKRDQYTYETPTPSCHQIPYVLNTKQKAIRK